LRYYAKWSKK